jgi:hypothetical protein
LGRHRAVGTSGPSDTNETTGRPFSSEAARSLGRRQPSPGGRPGRRAPGAPPTRPATWKSAVLRATRRMPTSSCSPSSRPSPPRPPRRSSRRLASCEVVIRPAGQQLDPAEQLVATSGPPRISANHTCSAWYATATRSTPGPMRSDTSGVLRTCPSRTRTRHTGLLNVRHGDASRHGGPDQCVLLVGRRCRSASRTTVTPRQDALTERRPRRPRRGQRDWHGGGGGSTRAQLHLLRASRRR